MDVKRQNGGYGLATVGEQNQGSALPFLDTWDLGIV